MIFIICNFLILSCTSSTVLQRSMFYSCAVVRKSWPRSTEARQPAKKVEEGDASLSPSPARGSQAQMPRLLHRRAPGALALVESQGSPRLSLRAERDRNGSQLDMVRRWWRSEEAVARRLDPRVSGAREAFGVVPRCLVRPERTDFIAQRSAVEQTTSASASVSQIWSG